MPVVLAISSQVVRGHVGNSAAAFALQRLGIDAWCVPTIILSNHPGHGDASGMRVPMLKVSGMIDSLDSHGWLANVDAVMSGYIADADQVDAVATAVRRVKQLNPNAIYCCDPIIGDARKGLYVAEGIAQAIRKTLIPRADLLTPNLFELTWLAGRPTANRDAAIKAAREIGRGRVLITSAPASAVDKVCNLLVSADGAHAVETDRLDDVPHGTGDLMAALMVANLLHGNDAPAALDRATASLFDIIKASAGVDELRLVAGQDLLTRP
jgi:pyridoxine kinase